MLGKLVCRNITVNGRRTSMRMEPDLWASLDEIAGREKRPISALISEIETRIRAVAAGGAPGARRSDTAAEAITLTASVRVFIASYYRAAATEEGHQCIGHGSDNPFAGTPFDPEASASAMPAPPAPRRRRTTKADRSVPA